MVRDILLDLVPLFLWDLVLLLTVEPKLRIWTFFHSLAYCLIWSLYFYWDQVLVLTVGPKLSK